MVVGTFIRTYYDRVDRLLLSAWQLYLYYEITASKYSYSPTDSSRFVIAFLGQVEPKWQVERVLKDTRSTLKAIL
jgi:hypothetical protein